MLEATAIADKELRTDALNIEVTIRHTNQVIFGESGDQSRSKESPSEGGSLVISSSNFEPPTSFSKGDHTLLTR